MATLSRGDHFRGATLRDGSTPYLGPRAGSTPVGQSFGKEPLPWGQALRAGSLRGEAVGTGALRNGGLRLGRYSVGQPDGAGHTATLLAGAACCARIVFLSNLPTLVFGSSSRNR